MELPATSNLSHLSYPRQSLEVDFQFENSRARGQNWYHSEWFLKLMLLNCYELSKTWVEYLKILGIQPMNEPVNLVFEFVSTKTWFFNVCFETAFGKTFLIFLCHCLPVSDISKPSKPCRYRGNRRKNRRNPISGLTWIFMIYLIALIMNLLIMVLIRPKIRIFGHLERLDFETCSFRTDNFLF